MANKNLSLSLLLATLTLASCSSLKGEKQVAAMEGLDRPAWASQNKAVTVKEGKVYVLGFHELEADSRLSAAHRLADNSVRTEISKMIQNQFSSIMQNLEEGVTDDGSITRFYSSEVSKNVLRDIRITNRYWEKVQTFSGDGEITFKLRVYSLGEIPEAKLKKMVRESLEKNKIDPAIKNQIQNHFESEINQLSASH